MAHGHTSFSLLQGWVAVEKSGEEAERESHGRGTAAEEEAHGLVQLHSGPTEEPALEAAPRAGDCPLETFIQSGLWSRS